VRWYLRELTLLVVDLFMGLGNERIPRRKFEKLDEDGGFGLEKKVFAISEKSWNTEMLYNVYVWGDV
jgi:hypothetical protein